jgi:hypothetical protein
VCEDQSWLSILLEIGFLTCSLSKKEIDLVRDTLCTREGRFFEEKEENCLRVWRESLQGDRGGFYTEIDTHL